MVILSYDKRQVKNEYPPTPPAWPLPPLVSQCWGLNTVGGLGLGDTRPRGDDAGEMGDSLTAVSLGTGITVSVEALPTLAPTSSPTASPAVRYWF